MIRKIWNVWTRTWSMMIVGIAVLVLGIWSLTQSTIITCNHGQIVVSVSVGLFDILVLIGITIYEIKCPLEKSTENE